MTGANVTVEVDDGAARALFARLIELGGNLQPVLDEIGGMLVTSTQRRFEQGVGPDGNAWTPSHRVIWASAEAHRKKRGRFAKTLVDTGRLTQSITHVARPEEVLVGTNVIYAAIHQFGGDAGRNRAVHLPARPFLGVSDQDRTEIGAIVADAIRRQAEV